MKSFQFLFVFVLLIFSNASATTTLFDSGLKAANNKNYGTAIQLFEQVVQKEKNNASAYYNLGNCYFARKQYGKAIFAFERVYKLNPRDPEASTNIERCYAKLANGTSYHQHTNGIQRLLLYFGSNTWSYLALTVSLFLSITLFLLIRFKNSAWKRLLFMLLIGGVIALMVFIIAAISTNNLAENQSFAIVTKKSIPTYLNDQGEASQISLIEGEKVQIIGLTKTKTKIQTFEGKIYSVAIDDLSVL